MLTQHICICWSHWQAPLCRAYASAVLKFNFFACSFDTEQDAKAKFQRFVMAVEAAKAKAKAALEDMYTASATHSFQLLGRKISDLVKQWAINLDDKRLTEVILRRSTLQADAHARSTTASGRALRCQCPGRWAPA
jgi:hypothetical protein